MTETEFKVGDEVFATTKAYGDITVDRLGTIVAVSQEIISKETLYRVEVLIGGSPTCYQLTADKLRLAQTPAIQVIRSNIGEQPIVASTTVTAGFNEGDPLVVISAVEFSGECVSPLSQTVEQEADEEVEKERIISQAKERAKVIEPPADPPKKRIRRSNEEQALGIPLDQILAYRADPEGWLKKEREATEAFHEVIEQAVESHWEDKAKEILEPEETGRQVFERLGWKRIADDSDATIAYTWDSVRIDVEYETLKCTIGGETLYFHQQEGWTLERYIKAVMAIWARNMNGQQTCVVGEETELYAPPADDTLQSIAEAVLSKKEITEPELMPQMEIDSLKPEVYNYEVMGEVPDGYVLARERFNGIRWYVMYFKKAKKLAYLPGTTSVDDNTSQPPAYLTKWRYDMVARYGSVDAMEGFVDDTAAYGTIMHTLIAWYINGSLPVIGSQSWKDQVCMLITLQDGRIPDIYYPLWDRRLRKDLTCWNQFMIDRNVKVHLMEFACGSTDLGVAGQIDLVCTMDFNRARVNAILDMKSGKKSTGQGNTKATQLGIYKLLFDRVFPDWKYGDTGKSPMGITKFFNWHPNDYSEVPSKDTGLVVPTYELVNQTDSVDWKEIDLQMKLFKHRTQGVKPGSNARFSIEGELKPFTDNQDLIKGGLRQDTYIEKYGLEVCDD